VTATAYLAPLREGGSLPAVIEAEDGELYVLKFVGAGHGHRALVAEIIAGHIGMVLGLNVPEIVLVHLDPKMARSERDEEIQDLLWASAGLNMGVRFLQGALAFHASLAPPPDADQAASIVWFDAFVTNVDRTSQNPNLLVWGDRVWLIDHGSSLYFHHNWARAGAFPGDPFVFARHHALLALAGDLDAADRRARGALDRPALEAVVDMVPDGWLADDPRFASAADHRAAYVDALSARLSNSSVFVTEAARARAELV
jgi:hypothetical protein